MFLTVDNYNNPIIHRENNDKLQENKQKCHSITWKLITP